MKRPAGVFKRDRPQELPSPNILDAFLSQQKPARLIAGKNPERFYVYALRLGGAEFPFYIGKGQENRCWAHFEIGVHFETSRKARTISKAMWAGRKIFIEILHKNLDEPTSFALECCWIFRFGRLDNHTGILTNLTDGGEGGSGIVVPDWLRDRHRENSLAMWADPDFKTKMSAVQTVAQNRPELKAQKSAQNKERWSHKKNRDEQREKQYALWYGPGGDRRRAAKGEFWSKHWANPENRKRQSKSHQSPDQKLVTNLALYNPLFTLVKAHVAKRVSLVQCRYCGGEVRMRNDYPQKDIIPPEHTRCMIDVFGRARIKPQYLNQVKDAAPTDTPFTFKFAPAGVIFFDLDGNEISRIRLPIEYTTARIAGARLLTA